RALTSGVSHEFPDRAENMSWLRDLALLPLASQAAPVSGCVHSTTRFPSIWFLSNRRSEQYSRRHRIVRNYCRGRKNPAVGRAPQRASPRDVAFTGGLPVRTCPADEQGPGVLLPTTPDHICECRRSVRETVGFLPWADCLQSTQAPRDSCRVRQLLE